MITKLSYFLAVVKYRSISKAAEELYISQPALSSAIKRLENTLDAKLIERNSYGVSITPAGERVARYAADICSFYSKMINDLRIQKTLGEGMFRLGTGMRHGINLVDGFLYRHPAENILIIQYNNYYELRQALLNQEIDVCLVAPPVEGSLISTKKVCTEPLCAAFGKRHPFARRSEVSLEELIGTKLLALPNSYALRIVIDGVFAEAGMSPSYMIQAENDALASLLHESEYPDYVAVYPISRCLDLNRAYPDIRFCPIAGNVTRTIAVSWLDKTPLTNTFHLFLDYLEGYYQSEKFTLRALELQE